MTKIAIDAGHGSQTAGKRTPDGYREHWINVKTAYYLEQEKNHYTTIYLNFQQVLVPLTSMSKLRQ